MNRTIRIDKGFGDAKIIINTPIISEYCIFNGGLKDAITITSLMINKPNNFFKWEYEKDFINDWKNLCSESLKGESQ